MTSADPWGDYYTVLTPAAAALAGLAFVVFSRSAEKWRTDELLNVIGFSVLAEFMAPVFVGLGHFIPHSPTRWVAIGIGVAGEGLVALFLYQKYKTQCTPRTPRVQEFMKWQRRLVWVSFVAYGVLIAGGISVPQVGSYLIGWTTFWLLFSASYESWYFLDVGLEEKPQAAVPDRAPDESADLPHEFARE